ncbi:MAG: UvrD-helicase domain-containing protein [Alphaproteobacteria bacterium]|nr:UvrD-helicase domain-containing protein [Alphaproteobacteria bacterium]
MELNLGNLNDEQLDAVNAVENGPVLVTAGAGTGKTSVLIATIAGVVLQKKLATPWQILAMTFTNKAANEIRDRIRNATNENVSWLGTFHSVCLRILRYHADKVSLRSDFLIYNEDDQARVIKNIVGTTTKSPAEYVEEFSRIKDGGTSAFNYENKIFQQYNAELARLGAVDFGDIILYTLKLFNEHPEILSEYQNKFKYIFVDEFQDTNAAQMEFLKTLTRGIENPHIYCVGDEDQSIYSWRGAEIKNIVDFKQTYPTATIKRLQTNYRSTGNILGAANSLIAHNADRYDKVLRTSEPENMGEPVYVLTLPSDLDEVRFITDEIIHSSTDYNDIAILIRNGSLSRTFETEFTQRRIPYRLVGAQKFYERAEVRDAIAYIRLLLHPFDDMSFMRIISKPSRHIGPSAIQKIKAAGVNLLDGLRNASLSKQQRISADEFLSAFDFDWESQNPSDAARELLTRTGYIKMWQESKDETATDRLNNIKDLINTISKYNSLSEFLEQASLQMTDDNADIDFDKSAVTIMTIHAAKGLEFDTVFLPAWEENIFPNEKSIRDGSLAEERRLAYVAITRAKRRAIITNAMSRFVYGSRQYNQMSRFINEMSPNFISMQGAAPKQVKQTFNATPKKHFYQSASLVGKLVEHCELGAGVVIEEGTDILTVAFKNKGIKKVAKNFLKIL